MITITTRVLTSREIHDQAAQGVVKSGGNDLVQEVDDEAAVGTALQAFSDGIYLLMDRKSDFRNHPALPRAQAHRDHE